MKVIAVILNLISMSVFICLTCSIHLKNKSESYSVSKTRQELKELNELLGAEIIENKSLKELINRNKVELLDSKNKYNQLKKELSKAINDREVKVDQVRQQFMHDLQGGKIQNRQLSEQLQYYKIEYLQLKQKHDQLLANLRKEDSALLNRLKIPHK